MVALSPFHPGEQAVQLSTGGQYLRDAVEQMGRRVVRDEMPQQHSEFFGNQQLLYFAAQDPATSTVWASVLAGPPGFIRSPNCKLLSIAGPAHVAGDPAAAAGCLEVGSKIGILGLELATRRRNRMNGTLMAPQQDGGLLIAVNQSFGNCPKYIQSRDVELDPALLQHMSTKVPSVVQQGTGALGPEQAGLVSAADTFFLATSSTRGGNSDGSAPYQETARQAMTQPNSQMADVAVAGQTPMANKQSASGLDMSHRGGAPGFVVVSKDGRSLQWPDYKGNDMFNSLGNLALNPTAGLLFIDWATGDTLQLTGTAAVHFNDTSLPGGKRTVVFEVASWRHAHNALPIKKATFLNASPHNPAVLQPAGLLQGAAAAGERLTCTDVRVEAVGIKSYFFEATAAMKSSIAAGKWPYQPGQYAIFDFQLADLTNQHSQAVSDNTAAQTTSAPTADIVASRNSTVGQAAAAAGSVTVHRNWTISSHPADTVATGQFSITVKRAGLVSSYLWDRMRPGRHVQCRGVGGTFTLEGCTQRPLLLVAGGIGITPLRSMFKESIRQARPATLIYSVSQSSEAAFLDELVAAAHTANKATAKATAAPVTAPAEAAMSGDIKGVAKVQQSVGPAYQVHLTVSRAEALQPGADGVPGHTDSTVEPHVQRHQGRVTTAVLKQLVPDSAERCVFLCGPAAFMDAVTAMCTEELGHARDPETEAFNY